MMFLDGKFVTTRGNTCSLVREQVQAREGAKKGSA